MKGVLKARPFSLASPQGCEQRMKTAVDFLSLQLSLWSPGQQWAGSSSSVWKGEQWETAGSGGFPVWSFVGAFISGSSTLSFRRWAAPSTVPS